MNGVNSRRGIIVMINSIKSEYVALNLGDSSVNEFFKRVQPILDDLTTDPEKKNWIGDKFMESLRMLSGNLSGRIAAFISSSDSGNSGQALEERSQILKISLDIVDKLHDIGKSLDVLSGQELQDPTKRGMQTGNPTPKPEIQPEASERGNIAPSAEHAISEVEAINGPQPIKKDRYDSLPQLKEHILDRFREISRSVEQLKKAADGIVVNAKAKRFELIPVIADNNKFVINTLRKEYGILMSNMVIDFPNSWNSLSSSYNNLNSEIETLDIIFTVTDENVGKISELTNHVYKQIDVLWDITLPNVLAEYRGGVRT